MTNAIRRVLEGNLVEIIVLRMAGLNAAQASLNLVAILFELPTRGLGNRGFHASPSVGSSTYELDSARESGLNSPQTETDLVKGSGPGSRNENLLLNSSVIKGTIDRYTIQTALDIGCGISKYSKTLLWSITLLWSVTLA